MMHMLKKIGRAIIPKSIFRLLQPAYHGMLALIAARYFDNPSKKLYVIGVTGTAGKSTTVIMTAHILNTAGKKTGYITTAGSSVGATTINNQHGLSMPGGWMMQKQLHEMVQNNCRYAIVECTSEGLAQNRHLGITFQAALFTNLSPAHIDSHGSFEKYRAAKGRLFKALEKTRTGITILGVNADDPNSNYFAQFKAGRKFGVSMRADLQHASEFPITRAKNVTVEDTITFTVDNTKYVLHLLGTFNITNALLGIEVAHQMGVPLEESASALSEFGKVPGRMEIIPNNRSIKIIVDYAPEPAAMQAALAAVDAMPHNRIIHVFGSTGGHRDVSKRFEFGKISACIADVIIITNDDVYDTDPEEIARNVQEGVKQITNKASHVEIILNRKIAIAGAISAELRQ